MPAGVLNVVPADREVGEYLVRHPDVDKVSFTGSTAAGRKIGAICGEQLKRCTLELGGKSAAILLDDVDIEASGRRAALGRHHEQRPGVRRPDPHPRSAVALRRDRRCAHRRRWRRRRSATPPTSRPNVGPLITERAARPGRGLHRKIGVDEGARVATGGGRPDGLDKGWFVEPTVFADVTNDMRIAQEEIFGPVVSVIAYDDDDEAVAHRQRLRLRPVRLGVGQPTSTPALDVARQRSHRHLQRSTRTAWRSARPSAATRTRASGRELGPEGLEEFLEYKTINLPAGTEPTLKY